MQRVLHTKGPQTLAGIGVYVKSPSNIASGINTFMHDGHLYEHLYSGTTLSCTNPLSSGQLIMQQAGRHTCHSLRHQQHRKNDTRVVHSPELNEKNDTRVILEACCW